MESVSFYFGCRCIVFMIFYNLYNEVLLSDPLGLMMAMSQYFFPFCHFKKCAQSAAIVTPLRGSNFLQTQFPWGPILRTGATILLPSVSLSSIILVTGIISGCQDFSILAQFVYSVPDLLVQSILYPLLFALPFLPSYRHNLKTVVFFLMGISILFHALFSYLLVSVFGLENTGLILSATFGGFIFIGPLICIIDNIYALPWLWEFICFKVHQRRFLVKLVVITLQIVPACGTAGFPNNAIYIGCMFLISISDPIVTIKDTRELELDFGIKGFVLLIVWALCNFVVWLITFDDLTFMMICICVCSNYISHHHMRFHEADNLSTATVIVAIRHFIGVVYREIYLSNTLQQDAFSWSCRIRRWFRNQAAKFSSSFSFSQPTIGFLKFNLGVDFVAGIGTIRIRFHRKISGDIDSEDDRNLSPHGSCRVDPTTGLGALDFSSSRISNVNPTIELRKFDLTVDLACEKGIIIVGFTRKISGHIGFEVNHSLSSCEPRSVYFSATSVIVTQESHDNMVGYSRKVSAKTNQSLPSFPSLGSHNISLSPKIQELLQRHNLLSDAWPEYNHVDKQLLPSQEALPSRQLSAQHQSRRMHYTTQIPPLIKGPWKQVKFIGSGANGSVFHAINLVTGASCAIKKVKLNPDYPRSVDCLKQLNQEIKILRQLSHPNIVKYYGCKLVDDCLYLYMEYVHPGSIKKLLTLTEPEVRNFTRQILMGLAYLHDAKIIHRDIKCANLLVDVNGSVKVADFGLAKTTKSTDVKSFKGTIYWMAPEVLKGKNQGYGLSADIWSLGCTVLEMLTGRHPYPTLEWVQALFKIGKGELPPVPNFLSRDAQDFILQCLQVNPNDRPTAALLLNHPFVQIPLSMSSGSASIYIPCKSKSD